VKRIILAISSLLALGGFAKAEDRALLIGVGKYQAVSQSLSGPETDVKLIERLLTTRMGFKTSQIKVLRSAQATRAAMEQAMNDWLVKGTGPNDRAFFYFSGHGIQFRDINNDEEDGCDEGLVAFDGKALSDDRFTELLNQIKAKEIGVIFDSCFSGGAYKSVPEPGLPKEKVWDKSEVCGKAANVRAEMLSEQATSGSDALEGKVVGMTAAGEYEVALDSLRSGEGSAFTQALAESINKSTGPISLLKLRDQTADWIQERMKVYRGRALPHHPQVFGPSNWMEQNFLKFGQLSAAPTAPNQYQGGTENAVSPSDLFNRILRGSAFRVELSAVNTTLKVGNPIQFQVRSSKAGYLNILELGVKGNVHVLFPNQYNSKNQIAADEVIVMPSQRLGGFTLKADIPLGKSRILALVTATDLNLFETPLGQVSQVLREFSSVEAGAPLGTAMSRDVNIGPPEPPQRNDSSTPQASHGAADLALEVVEARAPTPGSNGEVVTNLQPIQTATQLNDVVEQVMERYHFKSSLDF
jgi:metacaspase-1